MVEREADQSRGERAGRLAAFARENRPRVSEVMRPLLPMPAMII
jgi:hypothetical protein